MRQSHEYLDRKPLNQWHFNASEIIQFDKLIKIHVQKFKDDAKVVSKNEPVFHLDYIFAISGVSFIELTKYTNLDFALNMESFLISYDLDGYFLIILMVNASDNLSEWASAKAKLRIH